MKVNNQQKILGCVLVIGALALGADRAFILKNAPASEATPTSTTSEYAIAAAITTVKPSLPTTGPSAASTASLPQQLRDAASAAKPGLKDAFAFSAAWQGVSEAAESDLLSTAEGFRRAHRLTGVLSANGRALAVVDGKIVAVGQSVSGYRLTSISNRAATFETAHSQVILNMSERTGSGNSAIAGANQE